MTDEELRDALDGLHAYDEGATDSGIRDEDLRERCKAALREREADPQARRRVAPGPARRKLPFLRKAA
jgi:hypothetical protein